MAVSTTPSPLRESEKHVWSLLATVLDPEIPVLSVLDLGIVRDVHVSGGQVEVTITPTYSGCPAMDLIAAQIKKKLVVAGYPDPEIVSVLSPPWTTDWLSQPGREKLRSFGIAPPAESSTDKRSLWSDAPALSCPKCDSADTERISEFGSTPCKAHYRCNACLEPFDYFKCL